MAVSQLKDGRWIVYYRNPDKPGSIKKEYFGRGLVAKANAIQRNESLGLAVRRPSKTRTQGPTFFELAVVYMKMRGFKPNPLEQLKIRMEKIILPHFGHKRAVMLSDDDMDAYVLRRRQAGVKDNSIARELTDVKAVLNWSVKRKPPLIPFNPVRDYRSPSKEDEVILPPSREEFQSIYNKAPDHLKRFILMSSYIGARPGKVEILSIRWREVDWEQCWIRVLSAEKGSKKSRKPARNVPIHADFVEQLRNWWQADEENFGHDLALAKPIVHYYGRSITSIKKAWKSTLINAGITRRLRPYDLRHRFVTKALADGADIGTLAEIVGSRPETLRKHYQHVTSAMHRKTMDNIPGLGPDDTGSVE